MHTPYIVLWKEIHEAALASLVMDGRVPVRKTCGDFTFVFFPPDQERFLSELEDRLHIEGDNLWFEEGFMLQYPDPYTPVVRDKLALFELPSIALDGAFSRVQVIEGALRIDGSATYLQTLFSYQQGGAFAFANNYSLLEEYIRASGQTLSVSDAYFASHLYQAPLAYYIFCGTQWEEIDYHDSLDQLYFDGTLRVEIVNKFDDPAFTTLPRAQRLDILHKRLTHSINEFCKWSQVASISHHLTAGRDSRLSFALFKEQQKDRLKIETGGHPHTTDKVISSYICDQYGLQRSQIEPPVVGSGFSYSGLLNITHPYRYQVALFRAQDYTTKFNPEVFVANGFLGNSTVYEGSRTRQVLAPEACAMSPDFYAKVTARYEAILGKLIETYGEARAYRLFHLRYHTANKVSGVLGRLRRFSFCIFESDLFFLSYSLENSEDMLRNSLHYALINAADPKLARSMPYETGKSFPSEGGSFQTTEFKGVKRLGGHRLFIKLNFDAILAHIRAHAEMLPYLDVAYLDKIATEDRENISTLTINKLYALLGALEFKGSPLSSYKELDGDTGGGDIYTVDFFKNLYLDKEVHSSGLPGMVYQRALTYRSFPMLDADEELLVRIIATPITSPASAKVQKDDDGYTVRLSVEADSLYRIVHYAYRRATREKREIYRTHVAFQLPQDLAALKAAKRAAAKPGQSAAPAPLVKRLVPVALKRWLLKRLSRA